MGAQTRPYIVFVLCDNTGWGDFSCYGGNTPTPRIDKLASEGIRFNNYTVESQCRHHHPTISRHSLWRRLNISRRM
jgi:arylsulfatase A-like enzyme